MLNALAAIGVAARSGDPVRHHPESAGRLFTGVQRRFQILGRSRGVTVVDDYGHHPAEIRATLAAAKAGFECRVVTVFQPHRYTRTLHLREEFLTAFNLADVLIVMDVYAAGEAAIPGVTRRGPRRRDPRRTGIATSPTSAATARASSSISRRSSGRGDLVITLGAGDVSQLGPELLQRLDATR